MPILRPLSDSASSTERLARVRTWLTALGLDLTEWTNATHSALLANCPLCPCLHIIEHATMDWAHTTHLRFISAYQTPHDCALCHELPDTLPDTLASIEFVLPTRDDPHLATTDRPWLTCTAPQDITCHCGADPDLHLVLEIEWNTDPWSEELPIPTRWWCGPCLGFPDLDLAAATWMAGDVEPEAITHVREALEAALALGWRPTAIPAASPSAAART